MASLGYETSSVVRREQFPPDFTAYSLLIANNKVNESWSIIQIPISKPNMLNEISISFAPSKIHEMETLKTSWNLTGFSKGE